MRVVLHCPLFCCLLLSSALLCSPLLIHVDYLAPVDYSHIQARTAFTATLHKDERGGGSAKKRQILRDREVAKAKEV